MFFLASEKVIKIVNNNNTKTNIEHLNQPFLGRTLPEKIFYFFFPFFFLGGGVAHTLQFREIYCTLSYLHISEKTLPKTKVINFFQGLGVGGLDVCMLTVFSSGRYIVTLTYICISGSQFIITVFSDCAIYALFYEVFSMFLKLE